MTTDIAGRRRRHSQAGLTDVPKANKQPKKSGAYIGDTDIVSPVPIRGSVRPKIETPLRPQSSPVDSRSSMLNDHDDLGDEDDSAGLADDGLRDDSSGDHPADSSEWGGIQMDLDQDDFPRKQASMDSPKVANNAADPALRPTRPLPQSKSRTNVVISPDVPVPNPSSLFMKPVNTLSNPHHLPIQHRVAKPGAGTRKLYVILSQACLEAYRLSSTRSGAGKNGYKGKEGDIKYTLLNCDDHQGILAKTGRDIADARPDITHQVCVSSVL